MKRAEIYEVEYSVSPGGVDCWEMEVRSLGETTNYSEYKSAGDALNHLISLYPDDEFSVGVTSLTAYHKIMERVDA